MDMKIATVHHLSNFFQLKNSNFWLSSTQRPNSNLFITPYLASSGHPKNIDIHIDSGDFIIIIFSPNQIQTSRVRPSSTHQVQENQHSSTTTHCTVFEHTLHHPRITAIPTQFEFKNIHPLLYNILFLIL